MAQPDCGWFNILSQRVAEGLCFREDFGWAGNSPRTGANRRLDGRQGVWDAVYRGQPLFTGFFGMKQLELLNVHVRGWSWWPRGPLSAVGAQQGLFCVGTRAPGLSASLLSLTRPGVFTWTVSGYVSLSWVVAARYPVGLRLPVRLKAGLGLSTFLRSPSVLRAFQAGSALRDRRSMRRLQSRVRAEDRSLRKRPRAGGTRFCSAPPHRFFQSLAFGLFGVSVLLFGFRRQLLWFLWLPGPLIEVRALGGCWRQCFYQLGCPLTSLLQRAQSPASAFASSSAGAAAVAAAAALVGLEAFWSDLTAAVGMFQFAGVGWGNKGGSPSWMWRGPEWSAGEKHFSRVAGRRNDFLTAMTCRRQAV